MHDFEIINSFPSDFIFGTATSSYQIEGQKYGKCGLSNWDTFANKPGKIFKGQNGKIACSHILNYLDDLDLVKNGGFSAYRFSFSWPRLFPTNDGKVNPEGIDFYNRLLDGLLERNLRPFATLYHWDLPKYLDDNGGWLNSETIHKFTEYTNLIMNKFGDRLFSIATINEPWCVSWLSYYWGEHAPGIKNIEAAASAMHNILLAHGRSLQEIRDYGHKNVGIVLNKTHVVPYNNLDENKFAAQLYDQIHNKWFDDAIFKGQYPKELLKILRPFLPANYDNDLKIISKKIDWIGINYYTRAIVKNDLKEKNFQFKVISGKLPKTDMGWEIYPEGLGLVVNDFVKNYAEDLPIYITENGMANRDIIDNGKIEDKNRISYYSKHLKEVYNLLISNIKIKGYFAWSLLDNFEWSFGYDKRFGLVYVDFKNQKRTPKSSWYMFKNYLSRKKKAD